MNWIDDLVNLMPSDEPKEPTTFNGPDMREFPSADEERTAQLEQDWYSLMTNARDFALKHGADKMLRCIGDVFADQPNLFRG